MDRDAEKIGGGRLLGWLIGLAHARHALGLQIAINIINAAATVLLVLVLHMGIAGAAIAAVAAEAVGTAFLLAAVVGSGIMGSRLAGGQQALALLANTIATANPYLIKLFITVPSSNV